MAEKPSIWVYVIAGVIFGLCAIVYIMNEYQDIQKVQEEARTTRGGGRFRAAIKKQRIVALFIFAYLMYLLYQKVYLGAMKM